MPSRLQQPVSLISIKIGEIKETTIKKSQWGIPTYQYYNQHKKIKATKVYQKNVYDNYGNNILIAPNRTYTEIMFEEWCEGYDKVKHIYKNGDKGEDFFSLVYRRAFRRNHFYPDYIIQTTDGKIWILEAKGGMTADGSSNNIDKYAGKKFEALKEYCSRHTELHWGFVRAVGTQLYISNTAWSEDMTNERVWRPIESLI